jgi:hypothetical protein
MTDHSQFPPSLRKLVTEDAPNDPEARFKRLEAAVLEIAHGHHEADAAADGGTAVGDRVAELEATVAEQQATLEALSGVAEADESTPQTRRRDACLGLINQAEADDPDRGKVGWTYRDIVAYLEANGHGSVYPSQAYRIMEALDEADGFAHTENQDGEQVIRCNLRRVNANTAVNSVNNGNPGGGTTDDSQAGVNTSEP